VTVSASRVAAIGAAIRLLSVAQQRRVACRPVRDILPDGDLAAAYAVQAGVIAGQLAAGARVIGRKTGLTNPEVQAQLGVDQPDFGVLLDTMRCAQGEPLDITRLLQPKIEAELAFVLACDLDQPDVTETDVTAATAHVIAALEIVDSRIAGWDITITDTVADNASSGLFVLGDCEVPPGAVDMARAEMTMRSGGQVVSAGITADCLGSPLAAVAWLANTARGYGTPLRAGDIILSGALGPMVPVTPGSEFIATVSGAGSVSASFTRAADMARTADAAGTSARAEASASAGTSA
jgi:2-keto-4-pentenoate hydratase